MSKTEGLNERGVGPKERIKDFWDLEENDQGRNSFKRDSVGIFDE